MEDKVARFMVRAAVKIHDQKQDKEIVIPCHRHCDAFVILKEFGYSSKDYKVLDQGFLDANDNFYNRIDARRSAIESGQIVDSEYPELYSEDLW